MRAMWAVILIGMLAAIVGAAEPAAWETKCELSAAGRAAETITLFADGRMAKGAGEARNRWQWTADGLWLRWYSGRVLFKPVPGEPGLFRGRRMNVPARTEAPEQELRVQQPDRAGVLAWLEPLIDGRAPSAIEIQADRAARADVADEMARQWAGVQAAARALDGAQAALDEEARKARATQRDAAHDQASLREANRLAAKYRGQTARRIDPYYSDASFFSALSKWRRWENLRDAAESNLDHNQAALERIRDRGQRLAAELRQAQAAYDLAAADYWIEFGNRWRPLYQQRKAAFKAEAARLRAAAAG